MHLNDAVPLCNVKNAQGDYEVRGTLRVIVRVRVKVMWVLVSDPDYNPQPS